MLFTSTFWAGHWNRFVSALAGFRRDSSAATATEYGLMLAGIAVFILVAVFAIGDELDNLFTVVQTRVANSYS